MSEIIDETKPWLEKRWDRWEVNPVYGQPIRVNIGVDQTVEIDKLYGPLAAFCVRIRLEYKTENGKTISDWVVERERPSNVGDASAPMEWLEIARWDCQLDWWTDNE